MQKEALLLMAMAVGQNPCGDPDTGWQAVWTMSDGKEIIEQIVKPITTQTMLDSATQVKICCPACGSTWTITDKGDGIMTADVQVVDR